MIDEFGDQIGDREASNEREQDKHNQFLDGISVGKQDLHERDDAGVDDQKGGGGGGLLGVESQPNPVRSQYHSSAYSQRGTHDASHEAVQRVAVHQLDLHSSVHLAADQLFPNYTKYQIEYHSY